jgi:hypothetical protein
MGLQIVGVIVVICLIAVGVQWLFDNVSIKKRRK